MDPPVGILGRPTMDFRFSCFLGWSQLFCEGEVEKCRLHLSDACISRHGVQRDIRRFDRAVRRVRDVVAGRVEEAIALPKLEVQRTQ